MVVTVETQGDMNRMGRRTHKETPTVSPRTVVAYVRVSTDQQEEDGHGLDVQRQTIAAYAAANKAIVGEWIEDVISGAKDERPGLDRIRRMAAEGTLEAMLVYKLDRLARDTRIALNVEHELRLAGAKVVSVSEFLGEGPMGDMMRTILFAFATFERSQIAARTKAGRRTAVQKKGTFAGGRGVYGYRPVGKRGDPGGGQLEIDPKEAEAVRYVFDQHGKSYQRVADELNAQGYRTFEGSAFTRTHVYRILQRELFYRGTGVLTRSVDDPQGVAHQAIV